MIRRLDSRLAAGFCTRGVSADGAGYAANALPGNLEEPYLRTAFPGSDLLG